MRARMIFASVLLFSAALAAQTFRGGIQGTVADSTGAAIAGAQVVIANPDTGLTRTTQTDPSGEFTVPELPLGNYIVTASKTGFRTQSLKGVRVEVSTNQRVNLQLTPGEVKETVQVTAELPMIETTSNSVGGAIEAKTAEQLPINGRDFTKLLVMVPGATGDPSGAVDSPGSFGLFSINGNRGRSNNYLLDGTDMNDGYRNLPAINQAGVFGIPSAILPIDALAEVPIISEAEPEYGRNSGGIINIVTKSGTNTVHGSLYEYFRNDALDARNFFNFAKDPTTGAKLPKNKFRNNQFGGSLGGPLMRDRTFFFVAYEGQREKIGVPAVIRVPTLEQVAAAGGVQNPVIDKLLKLNPWTKPNGLPAFGDGGAGSLTSRTLSVSNRASNRVDSMIAKIDHHFGGHDRHDLFTARYFFGDSDQSFPLGLQGSSPTPGYNTLTPTRVNLLSLSFTHVITPKLLMELRAGYNRFAEQFFPEDKNFDPRSIGLQTVDNPIDFGLPLITVTGFDSIGATTSIPRGRVDTNWQYFSNLSYTTGRHNWKFGYEFRRTFVNAFFDNNFRGKLKFEDTPEDVAAGIPARSGLENFLRGEPTGGRIFTTSGDRKRRTYQNNYGFYAQDSFRLSRKFTLNYGLRWDYFGVIGEKNGQFSLLDTRPTGGLKLVSQLYPKDYNNFAPRVGFAYDVTGKAKTVVRGGWGVYYDAFSQDFFVGQLPFNTFAIGPGYNGIGPSAVTFSFSPNSPLDPTPGHPVFSGFCGCDAWTVDQKLRTPYVQVYNLNLQQALGAHVGVQVGYVGSAGRKLFRFRDINQGFTDNNGVLHKPFDNGPFPTIGSPTDIFFYVNQFESSASSTYNALQTALNFRAFHGLTTTVNYTWSHSIDNASDGQDYVPNASQPDNSFAPGRERADSNFDTRQRFVWSFNYEIPKVGGPKWLASGWAFDGVLTVATGQPFNVNTFNSFNGTQEFFERPDLIGNPFAGTSGPLKFLNLSAFALPCIWDAAANSCAADNSSAPNQPLYHFGNLKRNAFRGPHYRNFDFSLSKTTALNEHVNMQIRADFFNIFNHPNFSSPLLPLFLVDAGFNGFAANPSNPRQGIGQGFLPITATPDVGTGNPFLGGGGPRNIQLALRFTF